ncbi:MAG: potassium channel family protein [Woeseia sp.]
MIEKQRPLQQDIDNERQALLDRMQGWLEMPMLVLAFIWLALFVVEVTWGLNPLLEIAGYLVWVLFIIEFVLGFLLAPRKLVYLRGNWLKAIALLAPALRIFRALRVLRLLRFSRAAGLTRGLRLLRVLSSLNRGMAALSASMSRRGFGYVVVLTLIVIAVGAAGMYAFESTTPDGRGLESYADALWWTAMIMTTLASDYWPQTASGRILCFFLSLYAFGVFGYVTASLASFFIGSDADTDETELASARSIVALRNDIAALRDEIRVLKK